MGLSVYTLSEVATDEESKKLAEKENASDLMGLSGDINLDRYGKDAKSIISDIAQGIVKQESVAFGDIVVKEVKKSARIKSLPNQPLREAPFWVLRSASPAALVELGYLSNKQEEGLLRTNAYRQELAKSLKSAIDKRFE
jgi:N-acetylmuramoyl-L-alanine amidase